MSQIRHEVFAALANATYVQGEVGVAEKNQTRGT